MFSNDRSVRSVRGSSLGVSIGTVQFKCQHAKAQSPHSEPQCKMLQNGEMICVSAERRDCFN